MTFLRYLLAMALVLAVTSFATAQWVPLPGDPLNAADIDENTVLIVQDKIFSDFYIPGADGIGGALGIDLSTINLQGGTYDGHEALEFSSSWEAESGQILNFSIAFKVSVSPQYPDWYIKDAGGVLLNADATGDGLVSISELVTSGPELGADILASLEFAKQENDGGVNIEDGEEFAMTKEIWVTKDFSIVGGEDGTASLDGFIQYYSQIPEPVTLSLLALGTIPVLRRRRKA